MTIGTHGDGLDHRASQFSSELGTVDHQAAGPRHVNHVERHQHRPPELLQLEHQPQVQPQVGGVHHGDQRVGHAFAGTPAFDHLERDLLVRRGRLQAVCSRQVNHRDQATVGQPDLAHLAFDRDPGVVGDLLAGTGEQVEQRRLAAVRIAHQGHASQLSKPQGIDGLAHREDIRPGG